MRRLPPKPPPLFLNDPHENYLRKALLDREDAEASKSDCKMYGQYSIMQLGISPLDLLFDVNKGIDMVSRMTCHAPVGLTPSHLAVD